MGVIDDLKLFGYAIQPDGVDADTCRRYGEALDAIERRKREDGTLFDVGVQVLIYGLQNENPDLFLPLIGGSALFPMVKDVLGNGQQIILNSLSASRSVKTEQYSESDDVWRVHIDHRMPTPDFDHTASIVAMICVDDMTPENGSLRLWPYGHTSKVRPPPNMLTSALPGAIPVTARRGSVVYWLGQTWHAIGRNLNSNRRWGIISHYTYWWIKPAFDYTQCGPEIYRRATPLQRGLLGFNSRPPASLDIRLYTVTDADKLPESYDVAMRSDFARDRVPATVHKPTDAKS